MHNLIITMGIDFEIAALFESPVNAVGGSAFDLTIGGNSVNDTVRGFVEPLTFVNAGIGIVFPNAEVEGSVYNAVFFADIAVAVCDILFEYGSRRIGIAPLGRVAMLSHKNSCLFI